MKTGENEDRVLRKIWIESVRAFIRYPLAKSLLVMYTCSRVLELGAEFVAKLSADLGPKGGAMAGGKLDGKVGAKVEAYTKGSVVYRSEARAYSSQRKEPRRGERCRQE
jgi:hypothetical protein